MAEPALHEFKVDRMRYAASGLAQKIAMFRTMLILFVFGACMSAPLLASAQDGVGSIADSVDRLDRNFDAADRSHDGLLSRDEAEAGHVAFIAKNFDAIDTSKRGLVSKDDVHAYIKRLLMRGQPARALSATSGGK